MAMNNLNPLLIGNSLPQQKIQMNSPQQSIQSFSPQEWEYIQTMRRTGWDTGQYQQIQQSDPYSDFINEYSKCSVGVQSKIFNDEEFKSAVSECDKLMQSAIEDYIRPQIMQTPNGRMAFERMLAVFRNIKDKYTKEEAANMEALQKVMQDEVVQKRIAELNSSRQVNNL